MPGPVDPAATDAVEVAALGADAGHEDRQVADDAAHRAELLGVRRADDEAALAELAPSASATIVGHPLVQRRAADVEVLQLAAARVARAAQREHAAARRGTAPRRRCRGTG